MKLKNLAIIRKYKNYATSNLLNAYFLSIMIEKIYFSLVCTVTCIDQNGEKYNLKKVFKLPVRENSNLKVNINSNLRSGNQSI